MHIVMVAGVWLVLGVLCLVARRRRRRAQSEAMARLARALPLVSHAQTVADVALPTTRPATIGRVAAR